MALASGFVLFSMFALANTDHHRSFVRTHRGTVGEVHLHPNYGNPDGPAALSGSGKDYAVPGWTDEHGLITPLGQKTDPTAAGLG
jgi:hypothetical protein